MENENGALLKIKRQEWIKPLCLNCSPR